MDDHLDREPEDAPSVEQYTGSQDSMAQMFHKQNDRLIASVTALLDKRLPISTTASDQNSEDVNGQLRQQIQQLQEDNQSLRQEISTTQNENNNLIAQANDGRRDLSHERAKNEELRRNMASLREMLVPPSEVQITDNEVQQRFTALLALIHRLVRSTWALNFKDGINWRSLHIEQRVLLRPFFRAANPAKWKTLHNRLRSWIFLCLDMYLLSQRHYGLSTTNESLVQALRSSESHMWSKLPQESRGVLIDWRLATTKVTEHLRDHQYSRARVVERHIWTFLRPLDTKIPQAEVKGRQMLEKICKNAFDLGVILQRATDDIYIDRMLHAMGKPISEFESTIDEEASEAVSSDSEKPQTIAYMLTGALLKRPKERPSQTITLEKGQAVVYE